MQRKILPYRDPEQTIERIHGSINMKAYTTYEQAADNPQAGRDTRTEAEWMEYYRRYVDKAEYTDFEDWLADMIRSGNLVEEKR